MFGMNLDLDDNKERTKNTHILEIRKKIQGLLTAVPTKGFGRVVRIYQIAGPQREFIRYSF